MGRWEPYSTPVASSLTAALMRYASPILTWCAASTRSISRLGRMSLRPTPSGPIESGFKDMVWRRRPSTSTLREHGSRGRLRAMMSLLPARSAPVYAPGKCSPKRIGLRCKLHFKSARRRWLRAASTSSFLRHSRTLRKCYWPPKWLPRPDFPSWRPSPSTPTAKAFAACVLKTASHRLRHPRTLMWWD